MSDNHLDLLVSEEFLIRLDDFRLHQPDLPSRTEAVRRLVEIRLAIIAATPAGHVPARRRHYGQGQFPV
jgi:hypothetical protein